MAHEYLMVYCTCPDEDVAQRIAGQLVERRLAACASILPGLTSVYRWQGRIESSREALLLIKTRAACYAGLETLLHDLHPYELPEIVAVPITTGLPEYLSWIAGNTLTDQDRTRMSQEQDAP